jgi:hypothetical protein
VLAIALHVNANATQKWSNAMHSNTYNVVGYSELHGTYKVRFANGLAQRKKVLERNEHINIKLVECNAMHKLQCVQWALASEHFAEDEMAQKLFGEYVKLNAV